MGAARRIGHEPHPPKLPTWSGEVCWHLGTSVLMGRPRRQDDVFLQGKVTLSWRNQQPLDSSQLDCSCVAAASASSSGSSTTPRLDRLTPEGTGLPHRSKCRNVKYQAYMPLLAEWLSFSKVDSLTMALIAA